MIKHLSLPVSYEDIRDLNIGDTVYISGTVVTGRDDAHEMISKGVCPPIDLNGLAVYHAGPIVSEKAGVSEIVSCGPTTSMRMENTQSVFIEKTGVKIIIGKGRMGEKTENACKKYGAIHCVFPGGCAVVAANAFKKVNDVFFRELGMPEAMWVLDADEFGPLTVSIDTKGRNLFSENFGK